MKTVMRHPCAALVILAIAIAAPVRISLGNTFVAFENLTCLGNADAMRLRIYCNVNRRYATK
jgi:hypothetical protein